MIYLTKYESFANLQESSQTDSKNKAKIYVHWLLYRLVLDDICKCFKNQNTYFVSSKSMEYYDYYRYYYTDWINDIMNNSDRVAYLDRVTNRYSYYENSLEVVPKFEPEQTYLRPYIVLSTPTIADLSTTLSEQHPGRKDRSLPVSESFMKQKNIIDSSYRTQIHKWAISLEDFLSNYISDSVTTGFRPAPDSYHFKKEFIEFYVKSINKKFIETCTSLLLNYQSLDAEIMNRQSSPLDEYLNLTKKSSFAQLSDYLDFITCNDSFFQDILLEVKERQSAKVLNLGFPRRRGPLKVPVSGTQDAFGIVAALPDVLSFHILMNGSDVMIQEYYFSRGFINAIETSPKLMSLCKKNIPNLYKNIKKQRGEDQEWKTDLSADMGDLGFD